MSKTLNSDFRHRLTPQEACLWVHLRRMRADGYHWRKQHPWSRFTLDFVCLSYGLVVEVDGGHHQADDRQADHDLMRDAVLARAGFRTLRFSNREVDREIDLVMQTVRGVLATSGPTRFARQGRANHPPASGRD